KNNKSALMIVKELLEKEWVSFSATENTFVRTNGGNKVSPSGFCELTINEMGCLISGKLRFFNVEVKQRQRELEKVVNLIVKHGNFYVCKRPLSMFLMRSCEDQYLVQDRSNIIRSYLRHLKRNWLTDIQTNTLKNNENFLNIQKLAFQYLCQARLDEGCYLVSECGNRKVFYQEIDFTKEFQERESLPVKKVICGVQHVLSSPSTGEVVTELWMEPPQHFRVHEVYDTFVNRIISIDRLKLSQLVTFDQIISIVKARTHERYFVPSSKSLNMPSLFNLPALLYSSEFKIANYPVPTFLSINSQFSSFPRKQQKKDFSSESLH
ncbi:217_t:CDS:1, partial [Acaulospora morrowiae]